MNKDLISLFNSYLNDTNKVPVKTARKYIKEAFKQRFMDIEISKKYAEIIAKEAAEMFISCQNNIK